MHAEAATRTLSTSPPKSDRLRRSEGDDHRFSEVFSAIQAGYGTGVQNDRGNASARRVFDPSSPDSARRKRIDGMTAAARDAVRGGERPASMPGPDEVRGAARRSTRTVGAPSPRTAARPDHALPTGPAPTSLSPTPEPRSGLLGEGAPMAGNRLGDAAERGTPATMEVTRFGPAMHRGNSDHAVPAGGPASGATRAGASPPNSSAAARVAPVGTALRTESSAPTPAKLVAKLLSSRLEAADGVRIANANGSPRGQSASKRSPGSNPTAGRPDGGARRSRASAEPSGTVFDRLVRRVRVNLGTKHSTARMHLHPPELGAVRVDVRLTDARLSLRVRAKSPLARRLIGERIEILRGALLEHGLITEKIELTTDSNGRPSSTHADRDGTYDAPDRRGESDRPDHDRHESAGADSERRPRPTGGGAREDRDTLVTVLDARLDIHI